MPTIYVKPETKAKLKRLAAAEHRTLHLQVDLMIDRHLKELGLPDVTLPSISGQGTPAGGSVSNKKLKKQNARPA